MEIILNRKLESIPIFRQMLTLLRGYLNGNAAGREELKREVDIHGVRHLYDPVVDYVNYHSDSANLNLTEGHRQYIVNSLYAAKGSPRVLEIYGELFESSVEYKYNFPRLQFVNFSYMKSNDITLFLRKLGDMLYYLMYYDELVLEITNLLLPIEGELIDTWSSLRLDYNRTEVEDRTNTVRLT